MATTNIVAQESFSAFDVDWRNSLISNCPMPVDGSYAVTGLPGLGGIELNESAVREHPYRDDAVQSMWAVNGAMLSAKAAADGEGAIASPESLGQKS